MPKRSILRSKMANNGARTANMKASDSCQELPIDAPDRVPNAYQTVAPPSPARPRRDQRTACVKPERVPRRLIRGTSTWGTTDEATKWPAILAMPRRVGPTNRERPRIRKAAIVPRLRAPSSCTDSAAGPRDEDGAPVYVGHTVGQAKTRDGFRMSRTRSAPLRTSTIPMEDDVAIRSRENDQNDRTSAAASARLYWVRVNSLVRHLPLS